MESGYSMIDDASLTVKKDQKLYLFRFPKEVRPCAPAVQR
jgi:hypothetical protein